MRDLILWAIDFIVRILKLILWVAIAFLIIETFAVVQPTSPLLKVEYLKEGFDLMNNGYDSAIAGYEDIGFWWDESGKPINFEVGKKKRTQEHTPWFRENGAFYMTTRSNFLKNNLLQNGKIGFVHMKENESIDIDTFEDLKLLEALLNG